MKDESHIVGREDCVNNLVSQLIDKGRKRTNLRVISVVGEGAIGKTALVRSVCNRVDVKNHFHRFAWVRIGPKPNLVHLMADFLKQLKVLERRDVEEWLKVLLERRNDEEWRQDIEEWQRDVKEWRHVEERRDVDLMDREKLSDELLRGLMWRCYLVVLDDLCELHVMDELMMVLADSRNGSRVIVTTRNADIAYPWYYTPLELSRLDRDQSKKLLEKCCPAFDVADDPPSNLLPLKETILSKSGGSPQNILLLGGLLSATTLDICTELVNGLPDRPTLLDVVRLSVYNLPKKLKQCALYLALFPKESEIPTRRLFRLWSAENLLLLPSENGVNRVDAEECFETLLSRNLVHVARQKWDGSARSCRLPGLLHDAFYQMAKSERFLKIYDRSILDEGKFDAKRIAIHRNISAGEEAKVRTNVPEAGRERSEKNAQEAHMDAESHRRMSTSDSSPLCGHQLLSYVSFNTMKLGTRAGETAVLLKPLVPKRHPNKLRVLDLEGVYKPWLPEELGDILPDLKYLGLRWTLLERLPKSVKNLSSLETLDLKYTNISDLPDSILEAENLRHLYMTEVVLDVAARHQLESEKSLNCNIQTIWGLVIEDESPMLEVLRKLTGLRKLALTGRRLSVSSATKHFLNLKMLKYLGLRNPTGILWPDHEKTGMSGLESLSKLCLLGELGMRSLSESHIPPNLKVLTLSMSRLREDPLGVLGKLKCLTTLRLFANSYVGKTLSVVSEGPFPSLRVLKLGWLQSLTAWTIEASGMPCLEDLEIKDCKELKTIDGLQQIKTLEVITLVRVPDELGQSVRAKQPNLAKVLVTEFDTNASNK